MAACDTQFATSSTPGWSDQPHSSGVLGGPSVRPSPAPDSQHPPHNQQISGQMPLWSSRPAAPATAEAPQPSSLPSSTSRRRPAASCPPHGCKAICGARPRMEDAYTAVPFLLEVPVPGGAQEDLIPPRIAPQVRSVSGCLPDSMTAASPRQAASLPSQLHYSRIAGASGGMPAKAHSAAAVPEAPPPDAEMSALHFFGVFDGHGGAEAALLCARTLHERLAEALHSGGSGPGSRQEQQPEQWRQGSGEMPEASGNSASSSSTTVSVRSSSGGGLQHAAVAAGGAFQASTAQPGSLQSAPASDEMDFEATAASQQQHQQQASSIGLPFSANAFEHAFTEAFSKVDEEFGKKQDQSQVGTTAVVALVGDRQLYIGNCGDSRAVLCRSGMAIPLTEDHKAARDDETARVEAAGGEVMWWNGERVMGVLAVSRSIGDHYLRPFVIAQPEVTILSRVPEDELLLLASDGLWDVMSNQEACSLAQRCLRRAQQRGASRHTAAKVAASVLTRAAIDQGSSDNVTVVVLDLSREKEAVNVKLEGFGPPLQSGKHSRSDEMRACHVTNPDSARSASAAPPHKSEHARPAQTSCRPTQQQPQGPSAAAL